MQIKKNKLNHVFSFDFIKTERKKGYFKRLFFSFNFIKTERKKNPP